MRSLLLPLLSFILFAPALAQGQQAGTMYVSFYYAPPASGASRGAPVYQGLAVSSDRGVSWSNRGWQTSAVSGIALHGAAGDTLFLATDYGVLRSSDQGAQWKLVTEWNVPAVLAVLSERGRLWAASARGLFLSTDGGQSWVLRSGSLTPPNATYISGIVATPHGVMIATADGLYRSSDQGRNWLRSGLQGTAVTRLYAHPTNPAIMAACSEEAGVWISEDGGWNWQLRNEGLRTRAVKCVAFNPREPESMLLGTRDSGTYRSINLGRRWEITGGGLTNFNITTFAFDPDNPDRVYAGSENGSFVSNNKGSSWQAFSIRLGYVSSIMFR